MEWRIVVSDYQRQCCLEHLLDCCGYLLRQCHSA
jgi:hypothetical protein